MSERTMESETAEEREGREVLTIPRSTILRQVSVSAQKEYNKW